VGGSENNSQNKQIIKKEGSSQKVRGPKAKERRPQSLQRKHEVGAPRRVPERTHHLKGDTRDATRKSCRRSLRKKREKPLQKWLRTLRGNQRLKHEFHLPSRNRRHAEKKEEKKTEKRPALPLLLLRQGGSGKILISCYKPLEGTIGKRSSTRGGGA